MGKHANEGFTSPPSKTAGEQDHSNPDDFRGDDADEPSNETSQPVQGDPSKPEGDV